MPAREAWFLGGPVDGRLMHARWLVVSLTARLGSAGIGRQCGWVQSGCSCIRMKRPCQLWYQTAPEVACTDSMLMIWSPRRVCRV